MLIAVLVFWLLVGLAVFFLAMRSGPRGAPARAGAGASGAAEPFIESKRGRRLFTLGIVLVFAAGLGIPALVLGANGEHKASVGVGGVHLNAEQQRGRELFARTCAVCHSLVGAQAGGRTGPNLDVRVGNDIATAAGRRSLVLNAIAEGRARGLGQMPAQLYQGKEAEEVADFVAGGAGRP